MIPILLRDSVPRLIVVALAALFFYALDPAFHQHPVPGEELFGTDVPELGPVGLAASLANLAGLSMLILLGGFVSADRRHGFYRMYFAHPTSPLAFYALRWLLALGLAMLAAALLLVFGQLFAWGELRGGGSGLLLAFVSALTYGGLIAFFSVLLPRGDAWVAVIVYVFTFFWLQVLAVGAEPFTAPIRRAITFLLPPQTAMQDVYTGLLVGQVDWGASAFVGGYGVVWLLLAGLLLRMREWP
jgi:hypothetical protein